MTKQDSKALVTGDSVHWTEPGCEALGKVHDTWEEGLYVIWDGGIEQNFDRNDTDLEYLALNH